jgi:hypothetical protein
MLKNVDEFKTVGPKSSEEAVRAYLEHLHRSLYGLISISITLKCSTGFFIAIFISIGLSMDQNLSKIERTIEIVYSSYARVEFCIMRPNPSTSKTLPLRATISSPFEDDITYEAYL